jgi:sugar/nucleoside kinase (ribokinase family)
MQSSSSNCKVRSKVNFISKIGKDSYGELALNTLKKNKINTESVIQDEKFTNWCSWNFS